MLKYLKKYWFFAVIGPLFMIGEVSMDLLQPRLMSTIIDDGVLGLNNNNIGNIDLIISVGLKMIGTVILGGLFGVLSGTFANLCSQNFGNDIRKDCFKKIMSLSLEQTDSFSTGSLITRVTNDVTQVQNMVAQLIRGCVRTSMFFIGGIACMMMLNVKFGLVVLTALPFVILFVLFFIIKANPGFAILQKKLDRVNNVMQEDIGGERVVKAYVREDYEQARFEKANNELVSTQMRILKLFAFMTPITNIILNITIVIVIKIGSFDVQSNSVSPGNIMAAITYVSQIMQGVIMVGMLFQTISRGIASSRRLREVLDCIPVIQDGYEVKAPYTDGRIEFQDVSFSYADSNGESVFEHINLTIGPGETVGILGPTGSGKTTLVNLIPRLYEASNGQVLVDGVDVRSYKLEELRNKIAYALQKSELFHTTIDENIRFGRADATGEDVRNAAADAQAADFIEQKEESYETLVTEGGMSLSGGQKQRVAISRALLKNAEILILDDSTSALDLRTEAALNKVLRTKYSSMTKIVIAQRIASIMHADKIIVLDHGSIAACGTHDELMKSSEVYQDIYYSQPGMEMKEAENNG